MHVKTRLILQKPSSNQRSDSQVRRISTELRALVRFLDLAYLPQTAQDIRELQMHTEEEKAPPSSLVTVLESVIQTFLAEFPRGNNLFGEPDESHRTEILQKTVSLVNKAVDSEKFQEYLQSAHGLLLAVGEAHGNTREFYRCASSFTLSKKYFFLNFCIMYLIMVEGVLASLSQFLLGLHQLPSMEKWDDLGGDEFVAFGKLEATLRDAGLGVFLGGYNRHLRNAIAHGHFVYDESSERMLFKDLNPRTGAPSWEQILSLEDLVWLYVKLDDVYWVVSVYLQLYLLPGLFSGESSGE